MTLEILGIPGVPNAELKLGSIWFCCGYGAGSVCCTLWSCGICEGNCGVPVIVGVYPVDEAAVLYETLLIGEPNEGGVEPLPAE